MSKAVLLDTHMVLWLRADPGRLTATERRLIDRAPRRHVSAVTFWEIALLVGAGRIEDDPRLYDLPGGLELLPVAPEHCRLIAELPSIHRDPFDRMLIAQARAEDLLLLSRDAKIRDYGRAGAVIVGG
ncbi:type II toxin-antitoxin system VapC family toxin [Magnetospirillum sp. UT-4]|uniref:type II toxin-antitoxin system VapC family toxin n=1 Tax=Magnetospirillum sp. UT-4 TaxID=2681467 RepID=UPI001381911B|nr:type II toxin-antitoxin system VapC family toxin [Magnetospirillum sp. UT-4]CAA7618612.1 conserved hypothetical protein [Magnetospirillum sp. UT-4]